MVSFTVHFRPTIQECVKLFLCKFPFLKFEEDMLECDKKIQFFSNLSMTV